VKVPHRVGGALVNQCLKASPPLIFGENHGSERHLRRKNN